jgi:hypothetical protein
VTWRYGMRFRKATTTSPTTAKAVAAIMTCSFHMVAFATAGPDRRPIRVEQEVPWLQALAGRRPGGPADCRKTRR